MADPTPEQPAVNPDGTGLRPLPDLELAATGTVVHLKGYGLIKAFKLVTPNGDIEYWATGDLGMTQLQSLHYAEFTRMIESYHRGIKQCCGIEKTQVRSALAQRNHIQLPLRAFLRPERFAYVFDISWYEAKTAIIRRAVTAYLAQPLYSLTCSPPLCKSYIEKAISNLTEGEVISWQNGNISTQRISSPFIRHRKKAATALSC